MHAYAVEPACNTVQTPQPPAPLPPLPPPALRNTPNDGIQSQPPGQSLPNDLPTTIQGICTCAEPDLDCEDFNTQAPPTPPRFIEMLQIPQLNFY